MTQSRTLGRLLVAMVAAIAAVAFLAAAASAKEPAPGYTQFAGCPSSEENPTTTTCSRSVIKSGHFQMGSKDVPITNPITLSGGFDANFENFSASPKGGLTPVKQKVPGGIIGLTGLTWLAEFLGSEALTLYAVTELAGQPAFNFAGGALKLPIRVHLVNGTLGNNCYVGSFTSPIVLNLTEKTTSPPPPNKPITGKEATYSFGANGVITGKDGTFVDNSFAAPGASGCVLTLFGFIPINLNPLVNLQSGLPSPAGTNETVQNFDIEIVNQKLVYP